MGRRGRTVEEIKARQAARGMDPLERALDPNLDPVARAMLKNPTNEAVQANFEMRIKRAMMSPEELEDEINERTREKQAKDKAEWEARRNAEQDRKFGLVPGTTAGFNKFASGVVDAATKVADFAVDLGVGNPIVNEIYKAVAPPGSKYKQ